MWSFSQIYCLQEYFLVPGIFIFNMFPSVLFCNPDLFFFCRFTSFKKRYTTVAFIDYRSRSRIWHNFLECWVLKALRLCTCFDVLFILIWALLISLIETKRASGVSSYKSGTVDNYNNIKSSIHTIFSSPIFIFALVKVMALTVSYPGTFIEFLYVHDWDWINLWKVFWDNKVSLQIIWITSWTVLKWRMYQRCCDTLWGICEVNLGQNEKQRFWRQRRVALKRLNFWNIFSDYLSHTWTINSIWISELKMCTQDVRFIKANAHHWTTNLNV